MDCKNQEFTVTYSVREVILYGLSIGSTDQRFVYEGYANFKVYDCFAFCLLFWAERNNHKKERSLPEFPPPAMKFTGVLPRNCLKDKDLDLSPYPIVHTFQSMEMMHHRERLPIPQNDNNPVQLRVCLRFLLVRPKAVGTFVTTEITIHNHTHKLCTIQSTTLVLGIPSDQVVAFGTTERLHNTRRTSALLGGSSLLLFQETYTIPDNQALLYRIASGDTNKMHVDVSSNSPLWFENNNTKKQQQQPLLHGLCTLGIASRIILEHLEKNHQYQGAVVVEYLAGKFSKPVLVGDTITIRAWKSNIVRRPNNNRNDDERAVEIAFQVVKNQSNQKQQVVVDQGILQARIIRPHSRL